MERWRWPALAALLPAAALVLVLRPATVRAEPYLMVRAGAKCPDCHTNITGGGMRTAFAHIHAHDILHDLQILPIPPGAKAFNGEITSFVSIGSDLRTRSTTVFGEEPNSKGLVPGDRFFRDDEISSNLSVTEFRMYTNVDLLPDILSLYVDEDFNGTATNREAQAIIRGFLPWGFYIKGGRLFPTYGLRVQDDEAFIRSRVGYTFQNPDEGGEIGIMPGPFFLASSITNGIANDRDVAVTVNGYTLLEEVPVVRNLLLGASFARQSNKRDTGAIYAGSNLWIFTYLAEFDKIGDRKVMPIAQTDDYAAYFELDTLLLGWLNIRTIYEFVKVGNSNDQTRFIIGANPFIDRFLQPSIQYRVNWGPRDQTVLNQPELWVELHTFF